MKLSQILSRSQSRPQPTDGQEKLSVRHHIPWLASPLAPEAAKILPLNSSKDGPENADSLVQSQGGSFHRSDSDIPLFREHHESSTVELFYDLFFVANLSSFTNNHEIFSADNLRNYIGFFALLWFTWLETSLFDVRFSSDSVFNRVAKAISFGVMTGFAICGAIYDTAEIAENLQAFRAMALILMCSRLALVAQYAVVLWYVRSYSKTAVPLLATMGTLFVSAMIFLGTFWGYEGGQPEGFPNGGKTSPAYIAWYTVSGVEALIIIAISCVWRVVSFKHTHLVERVGLLTLIIMGEGIIGMTKSVSSLLRNAATVGADNIGSIIAGVLLIYFVWVLYFDQIEHDRFGTIRQQIWAILHFPLHVTILLTVEGNASLMLWNIINQVTNDLYSWAPTYGSYDDLSDPAIMQYCGYNSTASLVNYLNSSISSWSSDFRDGQTFLAAYDWQSNLTSIMEVQAPFGSDRWNDEVGTIVDYMFTALNNVAFNVFGIDPEDKPDPSADATETLDDKYNALYGVFVVVWTYYFIAAGMFLIVLAIMYWFGKTHKTRGEYISIAVRAVVGAGITFAAMAYFYEPVNSEFTGFLGHPWPTVLVMLAYLLVIISDNLLVWHSNRVIARLTSNNREASFSNARSTTGGSITGEPESYDMESQSSVRKGPYQGVAGNGSADGLADRDFASRH